MKATHTPGPWKWVGTNKRPNANAFLQSEDYSQVAVILDGDGPKAEDAALIAAAPDLLAACKAALKALEYIPVPTRPDVDAMELCRAAIAKCQPTPADSGRSAVGLPGGLG